MRSSFIHVLPTDSVLQARQLMQLARIRHLPVLDENGRLAGIVSHRDVLEATASPAEGIAPLERQDRLRSIPVARIMAAHVQAIGPDETLGNAAEQMLRHKIGCLLVVVPPPSLGRVIGLITESDLLAAAYLHGFDARMLEPEPQQLGGPAEAAVGDGDSVGLAASEDADGGDPVKAVVFQGSR
jgi:CBS domain-containing membrane protein